MTALAGVDQRTQLVGRNRLELLLFRLAGKQRYGINVFKVQEVIRCPKLVHIPNSSPIVRGVANMRGRTIAMVDLSMAIGEAQMESLEQSFAIVAEYNRTVLGFLVHAVDRIINLNWEQVIPPPKGCGSANYLTAVTRMDDELVEIIDVEKVLTQVIGDVMSEPIAVGAEYSQVSNKTRDILVVDDSSVARNQIKRVIERIGMECTLTKDGREAWDLLKSIVSDGTSIHERFAMVIADVEMPKMDGYTLTSSIKKDEDLRNLYVMLHTSLSGVFNESMVQKVGANAFVPKFNQDDLATAIMEWCDQRESAN